MKGPLIRVKETRGEMIANPQDVLTRVSVWLEQSLIDALNEEAAYRRRTEPYNWKAEDVLKKAIWRHVLQMKQEMQASKRLRPGQDQTEVKLEFSR